MIGRDDESRFAGKRSIQILVRVCQQTCTQHLVPEPRTTLVWYLADSFSLLVYHHTNRIVLQS